MRDVEKLKDLYQKKTNRVPEELQKEFGHFNLFQLEPYVGSKAKPVPYRRRDYYKIMLVKGSSRVHYADKMIKVKKQALTFSNPQIPYKWDSIETIHGGIFCIFDEEFFHGHLDIDKYSVFQPGGNHIFELTDEGVEKLEGIYDRMGKELESDYVHKYDLLRNLVSELIHFAMKMEPSSQLENRQMDASQRISMLFEQLLERQFPLDDPGQRLKLRSASDYADRLNIHVNHLNRALKTSTDKTTSQQINERILMEAKVLLKHSNWNVSEIGYALGFNEATYFSNFFKKHTEMSPTEFRND